MSIYNGSNKIKEMYLGSNKIKEAYIGNILVLQGKEPAKVIWTDSTEYYRTPTSTGTLNINQSLPEGFEILVLKFDAKWVPGSKSLYDFIISVNANNKSFSQKLCKPATKSYVPVCYHYGTSNIGAWGGSYDSSAGLEYKTQSSDWYLSRKISNNTYYTNKVIYSNLDNTLKYYMPNNGGYLWQASNLSTFTSIDSMTFGGNSTYPAYLYVKNRSVYVCHTMEEALAY